MVENPYRQDDWPATWPEGIRLPPERPERSRTSGLAVGSLVSSLLCCCPAVTPLLGLILGFFALRAIGRSDGRLRGRGLAIAGIAIAIGVGVMQILTYVMFQNTLERMIQGAESTVQAAMAGDVTRARLGLAPSTRGEVTDEEILAFGTALQQAMGDLQDVSVDMANRANAVPGSIGDDVVMPLAFDFDNGRMYGVVIFRANRGTGEIDIISIVIRHNTDRYALPPDAR
jgi:hypothetical protein